MLRFDVYGRRIGVTRSDGRWVAVYLGDEGKRREARDVAIPPWLEEGDLPRYLADHFHESASPESKDVVLVARQSTVPAAEVTLREEPPGDFSGYVGVSVAFVSDRILTPAADLGPNRFREEPRASPFAKDYDREPDHRPTDWARRFDASSWGVIAAWRGSARVGGTVLVQRSDEIEMLDGRDDLTLIWDLRVRPEDRGRGIGTRLVAAAADWARARGCTELKVETQNTNVAACRFYERCGFTLEKVDPHAYPAFPDEIQMLWYKTVSPAETAGRGEPSAFDPEIPEHHAQRVEEPVSDYEGPDVSAPEAEVDPAQE